MTSSEDFKNHRLKWEIFLCTLLLMKLSEDFKNHLLKLEKTAFLCILSLCDEIK